MKTRDKLGIAGICLALALGCQTKEKEYRRDGIILDYALANGYDVKFGPTIRGYNLAIGNLTENGFSEPYLLAKDLDCDGSIDYFEVSDENRVCYQSSDSLQRLDSCKIDPRLKELANIDCLNQLERALLHERR